MLPMVHNSFYSVKSTFSFMSSVIFYTFLKGQAASSSWEAKDMLELPPPEVWTGSCEMREAESWVPDSQAWLGQPLFPAL